MSKESSLKKQQENLLKQKSHLETVEEEFYSSDKRFEYIFIFNGLIALLMYAATFYGSISGMDSKAVAVLWGGGTLQLAMGILFALLLLRKKFLHKSLYMAGLLIHGALFAGLMILIFILDKERILMSF
jgi:hypothetical protein